MSSEPVYLGVATPQANPTVEIEFRRYCAPPVEPLFTRLTSRAEAPRDRLVEYLEQLPEAVASFDTLPLAVFGFACTGSSYLVDPDHEEELCLAAEGRARVQVVTATRAIRREIEGRGARRIAILAPYPEDLVEAAVDFWQRLGHDIVAVSRIDIGPDTRGIYALTDAEVRAAIDGFDVGDADLLLLSGTGMPTIASLDRTPIPAISSNLCLATEMLRRAHRWPPGAAADPLRLLSARE